MDEVWYIFVRFGITSQLFGFPLPTPFRVYRCFLFQRISLSAVCLPTIFFFSFPLGRNGMWLNLHLWLLQLPCINGWHKIICQNWQLISSLSG